MKKILLSCLLTLTFSLSTMAYDFEVDGIYYNITSSNTVEVTYSRYYEYEGSITIPDEVSYSGNTYSVTSIGDSAFDGYDNLVAVIIGNSVKTIGMDAFTDCYGLNSIVLGESVDYLDMYAFRRCFSLSSITVLNPEPPTIDSQGYVFSGFNRKYCPLYVPIGTKDVYATANIWKTFFNIEEIDPTSIQSIKAQTKSTDDLEVEGYYTIDGKRLNTPQNGVNILNYSDGTAKKIIVK